VEDAVNPWLLTAGLVVVLVTLTNVIFTMVLPRRPFGIDRLTLRINRLVLLSFSAASRLARTYERKDAILAPAGPATLVLQLLTWAAGLTLGFGAIVTATHHAFGYGLLQALTAIFTVGSIHAGGAPMVPVDIAAGASWVVIVALQIAYLPTLYGAFSRRESLVALLESRSGLPAWGPELLIRHQIVGITDTLPDLYAAWEEWAADVAESHTTYPVLLLFRSPEPWYSWVVGLLSVLDAAAMHLALAPGTASSQARLCLRMGFTLFDRLALTLNWPVDPDPNPEGPIELSYEEYEQAVSMLVDAGFAVECSAEDSWPDFRGWRVNYESAAYRLCDRLTAPPAPWSGRRHHLRTGPVPPHRPPQRRPGQRQMIGHAVVPLPGPPRSVRSRLSRARRRAPTPGGVAEAPVVPPGDRCGTGRRPYDPRSR
jgi:hypothetical protein